VDSEVFVSSARYGNGAIRRIVLVRGSYEERSCGVAGLAVVDSFDRSGEIRTTTTLRDQDHDGEFDR
jgi:hypothetical protein